MFALDIENIKNIAFTLVLLFTFSLFLRVILIAIGQSWIKTFAHTATIIFLPIITYIITTVISGNIALSLGMVGALSIVRFRNPVKSPFELTIYFTSITMGIAASVSLAWLGVLMIALTSTIFALFVIDRVYDNFLNKPFFQVSFTEGNSMFTLELSFNENIPELSSSTILISQTKDKDKSDYILASSNKSELQAICNKYNDHTSLIRLQLNG